MQFSGSYSDGRSALRQQVTVELTGAYLHVTGAAGSPSLLWPYGDLELIETEAKGGPVRLTRRTDTAPRLLVADPAFLPALLARAPFLNPTPQRRRRTAAIVAASVICVPLLAVAVWFGLPLLAKPAAALVPHQLEERVGETVIDILVGDSEVCANEAGRRALDKLVDRLWVGLDRPVKFDVRVVESPMVNAMAAPGGHIIVFSALIDQASSPDELAGVLAHEVGHVVHRHSTQALVRHFALSMLVKAFSGSDWGLGSAAQLLVQFAYSRDAEVEADATAVELMQRAQLRTDGLAQFFARVQHGEKKDSAALWRYVSTHPPTNERITALNARGTQGPSAGGNAGAPVAALSASEWAALKAICKD